MAAIKWTRARSWCGALPNYHLPSQDEAVREQEVSVIYFGSSSWADLRMQIRLKLKETPSITHSRSSNSSTSCLRTVELLEEYLPLVLAVKHYHDTNFPAKESLPELLASFPPLFYGLGDTDLLSDRLVGEEQRAGVSLPVELMLALFVLGQHHAMYAEMQAEQATRCYSVSAIHTAERSWTRAVLLFRWSASCAGQSLADIEASDTRMSSIGSFFRMVQVLASVLAQMCAIQHLSTRISGLALGSESSERVSRVTSVCARRAHTLAVEASKALSNLPDSRLTQQLDWLLKAYEVRWKAIYYQCELTVFQLDANPEIAMYFCEGLLKLRVAALPTSLPQQSDAYFMRIAQELQLMHQSQITDALDEKKALLHTCQRRFGIHWTLQPLDRRLSSELLQIREAGPILDESQESSNKNARWEQDKAPCDVPLELEEAVATHVHEALLRADADVSSTSGVSKTVMVGKAVTPTDNRASGQVKLLVSSPEDDKADFGALQSRSTTASSTEKNANVEPSVTTALSRNLPRKRPSSATQPNSGWVTMDYGGKVLHFEKFDAPPTAQTPALDTGQLDSGSTTHLQIGDSDNTAGSRNVRRSKPRPASSPCYLSSRTSGRVQGREAPTTVVCQRGDAKMWAPMRSSCSLCERRFMRASLPGVVVMKRIFDLRRKWGVVIQDTKKYSSPAALYGTANVCVMCQEILLFEEDKAAREQAGSEAWTRQQPQNGETRPAATDGARPDEIGAMIHESILYRWHQQPPSHNEGQQLQDIAVNKRARQSSTVCSMEARNAVLSDAIRCAHTKEEFQPWWEVDLANYVVVHSVRVYLRDEVSHLYTASGGSSSHTHRQATDVYPLHISVSMKTGVGRDLDDVLASCVSSSCIEGKVGPPVEWVTPPTSRGRFVRIQCERRAILHIERVHVYVSKPPRKLSLAEDPTARREHMRLKLKRAAFTASVVANTATPMTASQRVTTHVDKTTHGE